MKIGPVPELQELPYSVHIYQKVHFIGKNSFANYLYNGTLGTFVAHRGAVLGQLLCRVIFGWFFFDTLELINKEKLQNIPNIYLAR